MYRNKIIKSTRLFFVWFVFMIGTMFFLSPHSIYANTSNTPTLSLSIVSKIDAFIVKVKAKRVNYSSVTDWNTFLDNLASRIDALKPRYKSNVLALAVLDDLSLKVASIKVQTEDNWNTVSVAVNTGTIACWSPDKNNYTTYNPENKIVVLQRDYCNTKWGKVWTICSAGGKFQNIKSVDSIKNGDVLSCGSGTSTVQTNTSVVNDTAATREAIIYSEKYELCNTEYRIASCVEFLKNNPGVLNMYANPNNTAWSCNWNNKADSNGWTMNYLESQIPNSGVILQWWGCSVEYKMNHCRKWTHTEVDAETIKKETWITNIIPNTWSAWKNAQYAERFISGNSNDSCNSKINGQMYYKTWNTKVDQPTVLQNNNSSIPDTSQPLLTVCPARKIDGYAIPDITFTSLNVFKKTESISGGIRTCSRQFRCSYGTLDTSHQETCAIVCDERHSLMWSSCVANMPTLTVTRTPRTGTIGMSNTVTWTSTNAQRVSYACSGWFNGRDDNLGLNGSVTGNFDATWVGTTLCNWWAIDFDGNQRANVADYFTVNNK